MSVLVICRKDAPSQDGAYSYRVFVDGQQRALIGNDSTVQIPVTPGDHVVRLKVKWCGSKELPIKVGHGEIVRLECRPNSTPLLAPLYITIWRMNYISLTTVIT